MESLSKSIIGVRIISVLIGLNAALSFVAGLMRLVMVNRFPKGEPHLILVALLVLIAAYFAWLSVGLWKLKNKARIFTLVTIGLLFSMLTANLIQHRIVPTFSAWWHYYIYPILFLYLILPPVQRSFTNK